MKIRGRLIIFNLVLIGVTAAIMGTLVFVFAERYLSMLARNDAKKNSQQSLIFVEQFFAARVAEQKTLSRATFFFRNLDSESIEERFRDYVKNYKTYHSISFFDKTNRKIIDLNRTELGEVSADSEIFERAKLTDRPVYKFDLSNPLRPTLFMLTRVQMPNQPLIGFVSATVPLIFLQRILAKIEESSIGKVRTDIQFFAQDGTKVFSKMTIGGLMQSALGMEELLKTVSPKRSSIGSKAQYAKNAAITPRESNNLHAEGDNTTTSQVLEDEKLITILHKNIDPINPMNSWAIAYRVAKEDIQRPAQLLRYMLIAMFLGLLTITFLLNRWLSNSLISPIENLTLRLKGFDLSAPPQLDAEHSKAQTESGSDEISVLNQGLSDMMDRLRANFVEMSSNSKFAALGEMAAGIAHEINNPLTVILGRAAILDNLASESKPESKPDSKPDAKGTLRAEAKEGAGKIIEMVTRISKTIRALRAFARSGELDPVGAETVASIIDSTLDICKERLRLSMIEVQTDIVPPDALIIARPVQVSQILMNLLNNAHDAITSQPRSVRLERWIKIIVRETQNEVEISVINSGPRIEGEIASRLFQPFFTTKPAGQGTGIGLSICERLAKANGAKLYFDDKSEFTRFCLVFPRSDLGLNIGHDANPAH